MPNNKETSAYELIINAIASGSEVQVTEDHVFIRSAGLSAEQIQQLLVKPANFKNVVGKYVFIPENKEANTELHDGGITHALTSRSEMPKAPQDFIRALFSDEILKELNLQDIATEKLTEVDGNLVYPIKVDPITKPLWDARVKMVQTIIEKAGVSGIEAVFNSNTPLQLSAGAAVASDLSKNIEDIIGIKVDRHTGSAFFYLNQKYLTNLVATPEIVADAQSGTIRIDKGQFSDYLGRVFGDMVIPKQDLLHGSNDYCGFVTPVIIPLAIPNPINKQNIYFFVIDVSGSLNDVAGQYKQQLASIIDKLITTIKDSSGGYINPADLIRLVFFSDKATHLDFLVTEALSDVEKLKQTIMSIHIAGNTLLDGTVAEQIDGLLKLCREETCNANMFIFTDGLDNRSLDSEKQALNNHGDRFRAQTSGIIPKFKIFRVGKSDISNIEAISKGIDAEILDIADVNGLASLFESIRDINLRRDVIQFVQESRKTLLPVYEGRLTIGPDLDPSKDVEITGRRYAIQQSPDHIPDAMQMLEEQRKPLSWDGKNPHDAVGPLGPNNQLGYLDNLGSNLGLFMAWGFRNLVLEMAPRLTSLLFSASANGQKPELLGEPNSAQQASNDQNGLRMG